MLLFNGQTVRVLNGIDGTFNPQFTGKVGIIDEKTDHNGKDLHVVKFPDNTFDGFYPEELTTN
jgi:hypothetical protein